MDHISDAYFYPLNISMGVSPYVDVPCQVMRSSLDHFTFTQDLDIIALRYTTHIGAGDRSRTDDLNVGNVSLLPLSYTRNLVGRCGIEPRAFTLPFYRRSAGTTD